MEKQFYTGKEIEQMFNIPQQYRSRYDKAYAPFISPCDIVPRTYTDCDVLVYQTIRNSLTQGKTRVTISAELAEMVKKGILIFHGDDLDKYTTPQQPAQEAMPDEPNQENGKEPQRKVVRRKGPKQSLANLDVIVDLSRQVGELAARNEFLEERLSDMEYEMDLLKKVCQELREKTRKRGLFR